MRVRVRVEVQPSQSDLHDEMSVLTADNTNTTQDTGMMQPLLGAGNYSTPDISPPDMTVSPSGTHRSHPEIRK